MKQIIAETKYVCSYCGKKFNEKCSRDQHELALHIKPIQSLISRDHKFYAYHTLDGLLHGCEIQELFTKKTNNTDIWDQLRDMIKTTRNHIYSNDLWIASYDAFNGEIKKIYFGVSDKFKELIRKEVGKDIVGVVALMSDDGFDIHTYTETSNGERVIDEGVEIRTGAEEINRLSIKFIYHMFQSFIVTGGLKSV